MLAGQIPAEDSNMLAMGILITGPILILVLLVMLVLGLVALLAGGIGILVIGLFVWNSRCRNRIRPEH